MAHLAPPTPHHRHREQLLGLVLLLVGASMALLAVSAFTHSKVRPATVKPAASPAAQRSGTGHSRAANALRPGAQPTAAGAVAAGYQADPASVPLVVLQNTGDPRLAGIAAASFTSGGWTVTQTQSFNGDILSTAAYYDPAVAGAQVAAQRLQAQFPEIVRVRPKFEGMPRGPIVVVVTNDYSQRHTTS
jgi:hypothetical protein